ncbi:Pycsar system effector family protein [Pseudotenacibaculum sp. MALMAid0570]|uniref:Pycsar system effector family protein n=1 Tax=Pseudotenacibaculum sp. MALMAid0570 TaxID=3143938 RepID=UPI0032DE70B9
METLLLEAEKHVSSLLNNELKHHFVYHNLGHTQRVVAATKEIIEGEQIGEEDANKLIIAAWFHDAGYTKSINNHEEMSVEIAKAFLKEHKASDDFVDGVSHLIMATKMGYEPLNHLEKVIRDADCAHFKDKDYSQVSELLRHEWELSQDKTYDDIQWIEENISFFTKHHRYYTDFALENWQGGKDKNLASLFKSLNKLEKEKKKSEKKAEELALKKDKARLPERGIETMFRVTLRNHITLSDIADTKANILLSVNAIIVSLALSNLLPKLDNPSNGYLIVPTIIFVLFTIASMILSVLATRPNVTSGKFTKEDVRQKKVNLLFFGNFHKMKLDDFEWAMSEMMKDKDYLYSSMTKDLYFLGLVLNRKYSLLRTTYTVFIVGIVISVIAFALSFKMQGT